MPRQTIARKADIRFLPLNGRSFAVGFLWQSPEKRQTGSPDLSRLRMQFEADLCDVWVEYAGQFGEGFLDNRGKRKGSLSLAAFFASRLHDCCFLMPFLDADGLLVWWLFAKLEGRILGVFGDSVYDEEKEAKEAFRLVSALFKPEQKNVDDKVDGLSRKTPGRKSEAGERLFANKENEDIPHTEASFEENSLPCMIIKSVEESLAFCAGLPKKSLYETIAGQFLLQKGSRLLSAKRRLIQRVLKSLFVTTLIMGLLGIAYTEAVKRGFARASLAEKERIAMIRAKYQNDPELLFGKANDWLMQQEKEALADGSLFHKAVSLLLGTKTVLMGWQLEAVTLNFGKKTREEDEGGSIPVCIRAVYRESKHARFTDLPAKAKLNAKGTSFSLATWHRLSLSHKTPSLALLSDMEKELFALRSRLGLRIKVDRAPKTQKSLADIGIIFSPWRTLSFAVSSISSAQLKDIIPVFEILPSLYLASIDYSAGKWAIRGKVFVKDEGETESIGRAKEEEVQ